MSHRAVTGKEEARPSMVSFSVTLSRITVTTRAATARQLFPAYKRRRESIGQNGKSWKERVRWYVFVPQRKVQLVTEFLYRIRHSGAIFLRMTKECTSLVHNVT